MNDRESEIEDRGSGIGKKIIIIITNKITEELQK